MFLQALELLARGKSLFVPPELFFFGCLVIYCAMPGDSLVFDLRGL